MCPCTVLGSTFRDLSPKVATEVTRFFKMCLNKLKAEGLSANRAAGLLSTITGAMVVANAFNDSTAYDRATKNVMRSELIGA